MNKQLQQQGIPLVLTLVTFGILCSLVALAIWLLNLLPVAQKIALVIRWPDVLVGLTIYLKTSIDFAIFIGNLMHANPGWQKRIAIEIGTAAGNALGTIGILIIWNFFREVPILMAIMIILAAFVLLQMAEESFEELQETNKMPGFLGRQVKTMKYLLHIPNKTVAPLLRLITPEASLTNMKPLPWGRLLFFSATIPFILGLDDFAGYIPLFSVVNVFGFSVGVLLGHMILNAALFISPKRTVVIVRNPWILLIGGIAFVGIAGWGFVEVFKLIGEMLH